MEELNSILTEGGSIYRVEVGRPSCLVKRLGEADAQRIQTEIGVGTVAGQHLALALRHVFGRSPDPSSGYRESIRNVEAAAFAVFSPKDATATLGKMIGQIKATPALWHFEMRGQAAPTPILQMAGMMELLWKGQVDRHGNHATGQADVVTQQEAEVAFHLAVTLAAWLRAGAVQAVK